MKIYQRIIANAPKPPRNLPVGKISVLQSPVLAKCWNFIDGKKYQLHHGQRIEVCCVYDAEHFTCRAINEAGECVGIMLKQDENHAALGYRFVIANSDLRKACPDLRPVPRRNFDLIGAIIDAES